VPVVSGNVSLYNEGPEAAVYPTPTIGMVGVIEKVEQHATMAFKADGHRVVLVGETRPELGGSEYLAVVHGQEVGMPPVLDLDRELAVQNFTLAAIKRGLVSSAHDCAEGGIAVCLAESAIAGGKGADIALTNVERPDMALFAESQSRIVLTVKPEQEAVLLALATEMGAPCAVIGIVGGDRLTITVHGQTLVDAGVADLAAAHRNPIYDAMGE
jgi:phosphoribosylformylglycinamidine synthase